MERFLEISFTCQDMTFCVFPDYIKIIIYCFRYNNIHNSVNKNKITKYIGASVHIHYCYDYKVKGYSDSFLSFGIFSFIFCSGLSRIRLCFLGSCHLYFCFSDSKQISIVKFSNSPFLLGKIWPAFVFIPIYLSQSSLWNCKQNKDKIHA